MIVKITLIPIELCQYALSNKKVRALQVFIWFKMNCSGKIKITSEIINEMAQDIGLKSIKTVKSAIHYLQGKKWITQSKRSGFFFIKSFERIREMKGYSARTGAEFYFSDIKNFKGFLVAAIISNLISVQKWRLGVTERKKRGSMTVAHKPPTFYPVANEALAKILGVSVSTAWEWKKLAKKQRFIRIRKEFREIKIKPEFLPQFKKYSELNNTIIKKGKVCEQLPDKVATNLVLRNRKKLKESDGKKSKHIIKGDYKGNRIYRTTNNKTEKPIKHQTVSHLT
jgi:hypothetical protein